MCFFCEYFFSMAYIFLNKDFKFFISWYEGVDIFNAVNNVVEPIGYKKLSSVCTDGSAAAAALAEMKGTINGFVGQMRKVGIINELLLFLQLDKAKYFEFIEKLENYEFLKSLAFLTDIVTKLNVLTLQLEGKNKNIFW